MIDVNGSLDYDVLKVLATPDKAVPRADNSGFFVPHRLAPMGDGPYRENGRPSLSGLQTSPARAFASAERSLRQRSNPA